MDAARRAYARAIELEDGRFDLAKDDDVAALKAETTTLWRHYHRLPDLLMDYGRTLTTHLSTLRAVPEHSGHNDSELHERAHIGAASHPEAARRT